MDICISMFLPAEIWGGLRVNARPHHDCEIQQDMFCTQKTVHSANSVLNLRCVRLLFARHVNIVCFQGRTAEKYFLSAGRSLETVNNNLIYFSIYIINNHTARNAQFFYACITKMFEKFKLVYAR